MPFTAAERRVIAHLRTPAAVQHWLNHLPYNSEAGGETLRSFRGVVRTGRAHCLEAALSAATILEQHRYPPLVLSFESIDLLDHVILGPAARAMGTIAAPRPGLPADGLYSGRRGPALSYVDPTSICLGGSPLMPSSICG
jgi:hypothetical protein